MKTILKLIFVNYLVIYVTSLIYLGFTVDPSFKNLLTAAIIWLLLNKIVKPIIKLLLLPINLITLNLFSWAIGFITLFLLQIFADGISVSAYQFPGVNFAGFVIPTFSINTFFSYLVTSILLNTIHTFILWLFRKDAD